MTKRILLATLFLTSIPFASMAGSLDVTGTYLTAEKNSHVQIEKCNNDSLCGKIVWLNPEMLDPGITPETAKSKAGEAVLGLTILKDFEKKKKDWRGGTIYDPGKDKLYSSRLKRLDDGNLQVKGCIAFICQTQIWTPVVP